MAQTTPATLALHRFGIVFELCTCDYDPRSERVGLQAEEALGEPAARVLKTLIPQADGNPASLLKSPCSQGTGLPTKTSVGDFQLFEQDVRRHRRRLAAGERLPYQSGVTASTDNLNWVVPTEYSIRAGMTDDIS